METASLNPADEGAVIEVDGISVLRFERMLPAPPVVVWRALTEADATAAWAFRLEIEQRPGGTVVFDAGPQGRIVGDVLACDAPRLLEYAWGGSEGHWHVCFTLDAAAPGSALTFDHLAPDPHAADFAAGWHWHLDRLAQLLRGEVPAAVPSDAHFDELQRLYALAEG